MKVSLEIILRLKKSEKIIYFGIADSDEELDKMYKLRYRIYLRHNYINENQGEKEIDEYDDGRSKYFIASVDNEIIGSVRLIQDVYLPTEKDCFDFQEPSAIFNIPRDERAELGRLVVDKYSSDIFLPRHLVLLGLLFTVVNYAKTKNIQGGYSFIKDGLKVKLGKLKFPFYVIEPFKKKYNKGILEKYFDDPENKVLPIYYLTLEIDQYLDKVFNNRFIFKKLEDRKYFFKSKLFFKLIRKFDVVQ